MIAELGHFALILALLLAAVQAIVPMVGAARGDAEWMAMARPAAIGQFAMILVAFLALMYAASDEFHQSFVPNRHPSLADLLVDTMGIGMAAIVVVSRSSPSDPPHR